MAQTAAPSTSSDLAHHVTPAGRTAVQHPPVTPGKVAMWLFLATEIMFFTGLIGSYIVLRAGSPPKAYSNLYAPATDLTGLMNTEGVFIEEVGPDRPQVIAAIRNVTGLDEEHAKEAGPAARPCEPAHPRHGPRTPRPARRMTRRPRSTSSLNRRARMSRSRSCTGTTGPSPTTT